MSDQINDWKGMSENNVHQNKKRYRRRSDRRSQRNLSDRQLRLANTENEMDEIGKNQLTT